MNPAAFEVLEIISRTYEHANFNSAFLRSVVAQQGGPVTFTAGAEHIAEISSNLDPDCPVDFTPVFGRRPEIRRQRRYERYLTQLMDDIWGARRSIDRIRRSRASILYISSTTPMMIGLVSLFARCSRRKDRPLVVLVCHGFIASLGTTGRPALKRQLTRAALKFAANSHLRLLCLSPSISATLARIDPSVGRRFDSINYPILWNDEASPSLDSKPERLTLGFLGPGIPRKGFAEFVELARELVGDGIPVDFRLIGFAPDPADGCEDVLGEVAREPVSSNQIEAALRKVHYILWTGLPSHYSLTASSTIADAMSEGTPGIFLKNNFVEYYYDSADPFGYLVDSLSEMSAVIRHLASEFDPHEYRRHQAAARRTAEAHRPSEVGNALNILYVGRGTDGR